MSVNYDRLFNDEASVERGNELVRLVIDGMNAGEALTETRKNERTYLVDTIRQLSEELEAIEPTERDYAAIGRKVMEARFLQDEYDRVHKKHDLFNARFDLFQPASMFVLDHADAPIAFRCRPEITDRSYTIEHGGNGALFSNVTRNLSGHIGHSIGTGRHGNLSMAVTKYPDARRHFNPRYNVNLTKAVFNLTIAIGE